MIIKTKIKQHLKLKGMNGATKYYDAIAQEVEKLIDKSIERSKNNGRKTVMARDL